MPKEPLKYQAYQMIKDNIVNCIYAPGAIINEELIREEIGASRTPIRDALSRLEQEGLVKILPKKGIIISSMSVSELNMLYEARLLIEPYVVKHYGSRIPQETYLEYYNLCRSYNGQVPDGTSLADLDDNFHQMFIHAADNSYFRNLYATIDSQIRRTRMICRKTSSDRTPLTMSEHLAIVEAALKNDWKTAAAAMTSHLIASKNEMFDYILKNQQIT